MGSTSTLLRILIASKLKLISIDMLKKLFGPAVVLARSSQAVAVRRMFQVSLPRYNFSSPQVHPTIQKIQAGANKDNINSLLEEMQALESEDRQTALRMIIKGI